MLVRALVLNVPAARQTATVGGTLDSMLDADLGDSASPVIVIRGGAMNPGETYVLRCDVLFRDAGATTGGASGSATVTALVNSPPSGGSATLTTNPEASTVGNDECCLPRHQTHSEPLPRESNGFL